MTGRQNEIITIAKALREVMELHNYFVDQPESARNEAIVDTCDEQIRLLQSQIDAIR